MVYKSTAISRMRSLSLSFGSKRLASLGVMERVYRIRHAKRPTCFASILRLEMGSDSVNNVCSAHWRAPLRAVASVFVDATAISASNTLGLLAMIGKLVLS